MNDKERNLFHSDTCYKRFLYAKKFAEKINEYIDNGYLVIDGNIDSEGEILSQLGKFIFRDGEILFQSKNKNWCQAWIGSVYDDDDKLYLLESEFSFKNIKKRFQEVSIVNPKHIKKVRI